MKKKNIEDNELIYGLHPIQELLKAKKRRLVILYTTKPEPKGFKQIKDELPAGIQIQYISRDGLSKLAGTTDHQGVVAYAKPLVVRKKFFESSKQPFLLMLDGIQDVRNLGAIIRSAYCTGVDGIIITKKNTAPLTAAAIKASAGLVEHIDIYFAASPAAAVQELKQAGYGIYLAVINGKDATKISYKKPLCVVIGSEGIGISKEILKDGVQVTLPQRTPDISYNASVAAGIMLFLVSQKID